MKKAPMILFALALAILIPCGGARAAGDDLLKRMSEIAQKAPAEGEYQIKAADLAKMIAEKKTDFLVVDVRIPPPAGPGQQGGKIPGSIWIPVTDILKEENIKKLPKDKKVILVCVTGQSQGLPILPLRALGYNVVSLKYGMSSWAKGYFGAQFMQKAIAEANYPVEP